MGTEKKKISLGDRASYFYIKNLKKWMFCPSCKKGKMSFNKKTSHWMCEDCGYGFSEKYFLDDCVFWFCDECETYLNNQEGFDATPPNTFAETVATKTIPRSTTSRELAPIVESFSLTRMRPFAQIADKRVEKKLNNGSLPLAKLLPELPLL